MKPVCVGLLLAALAVAPALAQKPQVPAPKKPAAAKPAETKPADKPKPKPKARPVARRVAPPAVPPPVRYVIRAIYQGDVPADPGMRSWQPPSQFLPISTR
jgi:hypothetical protein